MRHMSGDQTLLKRINRVALIRQVKAEPGLSRVDLAERTGLTKTTVGMLVQELIQEGWLCQSEPSPGQGVGRPPLPLALDPERIGLLGAEVGVDYLNAVACNLRGEVLFSRRTEHRHRDAVRSVRSLAGLIAEARAWLLAQRRRALGVGVGVPGMVDARGGILRFAPNLGWHDVPVGSLLETELEAAGCGSLEVAVLNEANAAALSEYVFGAEHHTGPLVYLSMGIGLGGGIVLGDRLYLGHDGLAGEVGHTILERGGPPCACGRRGCAEAFVSQRAVSRQATGRDQPILAIEALVARIAAGDRATLRAAAQAGEYLGLLLQNLGNVIDPAVVVLGGPLCQLGDAFLRPARRAMQDNAGRYDYHRHSLRLCRLGLDACAVGAAGSVFQRSLHPLEALGEPEASAAPAPVRATRRTAQ
jgi:predicted NBD/HSP70 family sugar kinase